MCLCQSIWSRTFLLANIAKRRKECGVFQRLTPYHHREYLYAVIQSRAGSSGRVDLWKSASHTNGLLNNKPPKLGANFARTLPSALVQLFLLAMMESGMHLLKRTKQLSGRHAVRTTEFFSELNDQCIAPGDAGFYNTKCSFHPASRTFHIPCRARSHDSGCLCAFLKWSKWGTNGKRLLSVRSSHPALSLFTCLGKLLALIRWSLFLNYDFLWYLSYEMSCMRFGFV